MREIETGATEDEILRAIETGATEDATLLATAIVTVIGDEILSVETATVIEAIGADEIETAIVVATGIVGAIATDGIGPPNVPAITIAIGGTAEVGEVGIAIRSMPDGGA